MTFRFTTKKRIDRHGWLNILYTNTYICLHQHKPSQIKHKIVTKESSCRILSPKMKKFKWLSTLNFQYDRRKKKVDLTEELAELKIQD